MEMKISLSISDLERIKDTFGITEYDDIHTAIVEAFSDRLDKIENIGEEYAMHCYETFGQWAEMPERESTKLSCCVGDWALDFLKNHYPDMATDKNADAIYNIAYKELNEYYLSED